MPLSKQFQATISSPFTNPSRFEKANGTGSWFDLFRTKGNRHRTWVVVTCSIFAQATGTTLVGYYLAVVLSGVGITNPRTQSIINGCLTMWNMAFGKFDHEAFPLDLRNADTLEAFWGAYKIDHFGRRPMMLTSLCGMLFCGFIPWTICSAIYAEKGTQAAGSASIAFIFIFSGFYATTW